MKTNELMIGDWVQCSLIYTSNKVPCKVVGISTDITVQFKTGARMYEALKEAEPIPLTAEILQANGFEFTSVDKTTNFPNGARIYAYENREGTVYVSENGIIWWLEIELSDYADNIRMAVDYAHQLQHAIKLCGIEKDIVL